MTDLKLNPSGGPGVYTILEGQAAKIYDPAQLGITGQITAPAAFFMARKNLSGPSGLVEDDGKMIPEPYFNLADTHVLVDRNKGVITLIHKEHSKFSDEITGVLKPSTIARNLGINSTEARTPKEIGMLLKTYRYFFANREEGMKIVAQLLSFKANISSEIDQKDDRRGSKKNSLEVSAETNVPLSFMLNIPIFEGFQARAVKVEIALDVRSMSAVDCWLESPEMMDTIQAETSAIIDDQLQPFKDAGMTIIEL